LGIPSSDVRFEGLYGTYHSIYDSFTWMEDWIDPDFGYHKALAQVLGLMALRLSDSLVLPLNYTDYGVALLEYLHDMEKLLETSGGRGRVDLRPLHGAINEFMTSTIQLDKERAYLVRKYNSTTNSTQAYSDLNSYNFRVRIAERSWLDFNGLVA